MLLVLGHVLTHTIHSTTHFIHSIKAWNRPRVFSNVSSYFNVFIGQEHSHPRKRGIHMGCTTSRERQACAAGNSASHRSGTYSPARRPLSRLFPIPQVAPDHACVIGQQQAAAPSSKDAAATESAPVAIRAPAPAPLLPACRAPAAGIEEAARLRALLDCRMLDTPPERRFDTVTTLMQSVFQVG